MHGLARHVAAKFSSKRLLRDQINGATEHIFQIKQNTKILRRRSGAIEADQNIDVTALMGRIARSGAEQGQLGYTEAADQQGFVGRKQL